MRQINIISENDVKKMVREEVNKLREEIGPKIDKLRQKLNDIEVIMRR